jgi:hypothetical protein
MGQEGKSFPAIHFPFRFPRPYLSPYHSHWGPTSLCPTRFPLDLDLSTVHEMWPEAFFGGFQVPRAAVNGERGDWGNWESRLFPAPKKTKSTQRPVI